MALTFSQIENHTLCISLLAPDSKVLDLGSNKGEFIRSLRRIRACTCFAVEPNPRLFEHLARMPDIRALNYAVAGSAGEVDFHLADNDEASSIVPDGEVVGGTTVRVKTLGLTDLLARLNVDYIDLLKVDIEGAEIEMFDAMQDSVASSFGQITVEFHDFCGVPVASVERVIKKLRRLGYAAIKFSRNSYGNVWLVNTRRLNVSQFDLAYAKYIYRNMAGAKRILARSILHPRSPQP